jgi:Lon protease-like protein
MFPLSTVLFPRAGLPLHVFEERYRQLMADCVGSDGEFGVVLIARGPEVGGGDQRVDVGTVARIAQVGELEDGRLLVVARGTERLRVTSWMEDDPYPCAEIEEFPIESGRDDADAIGTAELAVRRLRSLLSELGEIPALPHDLDLSGRDEEAGWRLCELAPLNLLDRQQLLAAPRLSGQMELLTGLCDAMADDVVGLLAGGDES